MTLNLDPSPLNNLYWITLVAMVVSSASGVLKAGFQKFDLFGMVIIAIAVGLSSGSLLFIGLLHFGTACRDFVSNPEARHPS